MAAAPISTFTTDSVIRGYHEYNSIWEAAFGEVLQCQRERDLTGMIHMQWQL